MDSLYAGMYVEIPQAYTPYDKISSFLFVRNVFLSSTVFWILRPYLLIYS